MFVLLVQFGWCANLARASCVIMPLKRPWHLWHCWSRCPDWIRTIWFCGESVFAPHFPTEIPAPRASRRLAMLGLEAVKGLNSLRSAMFSTFRYRSIVIVRYALWCVFCHSSSCPSMLIHGTHIITHFVKISFTYRPWLLKHILCMVSTKPDDMLADKHIDFSGHIDMTWYD